MKLSLAAHCKLVTMEEESKFILLARPSLPPTLKTLVGIVGVEAIEQWRSAQELNIVTSLHSLSQSNAMPKALMP